MRFSQVSEPGVSRDQPETGKGDLVSRVALVRRGMSTSYVTRTPVEFLELALTTLRFIERCWRFSMKRVVVWPTVIIARSIYVCL